MRSLKLFSSFPTTSRRSGVLARPFAPVQSVRRPLLAGVAPNKLQPGANPWRLTKSSIYTDIHMRHLALDSAHPFQERGFTNYPWQQVAGHLEHYYVLDPTDPRAPLASLRLGLHQRGGLSLLAFARQGISRQLLDSLQPADESQPHHPQALTLAPGVGYDIRPRASLYVELRSKAELGQVEGFLTGVHQAWPFDPPALHFLQSLIDQCHLQLQGRKPWQALLPGEPKKLENERSGYPNEIPDPADLSSNYCHPAADILNFPETIPALHLAVLKGDGARIDKLLATNNSMLYQRDPWGQLAIELAIDLEDFTLASQLFEAWQQLPDNQIALADLYWNCAWDIKQGIHNCERQEIKRDRKAQLNNYLARILPPMPDSLAAYQCVLDNNETGYQRLRQAWLRDKPAEACIEAFPLLSDLRHHIEKYQPRRPLYHKWILRGRRPDVAAMQNELMGFNQFSEKLAKIAGAYSASAQALIARLPEGLRQRHCYKNGNEFRTLQQQLEHDAYSIHIDQQSLNAWMNNCRQWLAENNQYLGYAEQGLLATMIDQLINFKHLALRDFHAAIESYKQSCCYVNQLDYDLFARALAIHKSYQALNNITPRAYDAYTDALCVFHANQTKNMSPWQKKRYEVLRYTLARDLMTHIRQALLSFERQDEWGYTPLLLAVVSNNLDYVRNCLRAGHYSEKIPVRLKVNNGIHYTLLEHARTAEMVDLLLHHFYNPNEVNTLMSRAEWAMAQSLLRYGHTPQRDHRLTTLLDRIIRGNSHYSNPAAVLQSLLLYYDDYVITGPYDETVSREVAEVLEQHNKKIETSRRAIQQRPKIRAITASSEGILTEFSRFDDPEHGLYCNTLMRLADLEAATVEELSTIFAETFRLRENDTEQGRRSFFINYVKAHPDFFIEVYREQSGSAKAVGFLTFAIMPGPVSRAHQQAYNVVYMSIAACARGAGQGLALSTFKVVHAAYQLSQQQGRQLEFYGRFGRPGLAMKLMVPGPWSVKYYRDPERIREVISGVVGDSLNPTGASTPPVLSLGLLRGPADRRIEEHSYWLNKLQAGPEDSLPLVCKINEDMLRRWQTMMAEHNGLTTELLERFNTLFVDWYRAESKACPRSNL